jgi:hypothetical protein
MKASSRTKVGLAIAGSVVVGILLGTTIFANVFSGTTSGTQKQPLAISGTETIRVIGANGKIVSTWNGQDPLTNIGMNAIVSCVTGSDGGSTTPWFFGTCSSWINGIEISFDNPSGTCSYAAILSDCTLRIASATNSITPAGCSVTNPSNFAISTPPCTGWSTLAIFPVSTFTALNCGTSCHVEDVVAGINAGGGSGIVPFDELCTHAYAGGNPETGVGCTLGGGAIPPVSPGDTLVVTIAFSIS